MMGTTKMDYDERAFFFDCEGDSLPGIVACPRESDDATRAAGAARLGVLIVGAGLQYRIGPHRQSVLLARALAAAGAPCMRFDHRGAGDATGAARSFESLQADIRAALDAFFAEAPTLAGVMLWGFGDGASAAVFYAGADADPRLDGLLLLNPWMHAGARVFRHGFLRHLHLHAFRDFFDAGAVPARALREWWRARRGGGRKRDDLALPGGGEALPEQMRLFLQALSIPWWVILSGQDEFVREFDRVAASPAWANLFPARAPYRLPDPCPAFSSAAWRDAVVGKTLACVDAVAGIMKLLKSS
ncbi:MAG: hydrolase 1, exosortase A system-associated [Azoarcus sp.]|jgi:exosortase A-associated hydrolase 1|nr:hydrolase 1, exosortase A system-associated [Azoarcus sp.]